MRRSWLVVAAVAVTTSLGLGQITFSNVGLSDDFVAPGAVVLAQVIQFVVPSGTVTINSVKVQNTAGGTKVTAAEVDYIEIRRNSETGPVLKKVTSPSQFDTGALVLTGLANNSFTTGTHRLFILIKLKPTVTLGRTIQLGTQTAPTVINSGAAPGTDNNVQYGASGAGAATFTVVLPTATFDGSVPDGSVYRGQRFLAGRIKLDGEGLAFETTIAQVVIKNALLTDRLTGAYVSGIEVRRASDDALLGQQTTASELGKLTTTGVVITTASNNKVPPFSTVVLEVWVTLRTDAPTGRKVKLEPVFRLCGPGLTAQAGTDVSTGGTAPEFTVGEPSGLDPITSLELDGGQVFSGQRFLALRIQCEDFDDDPYDVTVNSIVVKNVSTSDRLSEGHVARIEVVRARDGVLMGQLAGASGLNSGGARIVTATSNVILDDTTEVFEVWVTLGMNVPNARNIQLRAVVWHTEDTKTFGKPTAEPWLDGPEFTTGPAEGQGLETNAPLPLTDRTVFQGVRFLAQRLDLRDNDSDPYDVTIASVMVRNVAGTSALADQHVARLEIRRKSDGALMGEVTDPVGLSLAGVRVPTGANNVVPDDSSVELEIWVTLKDTAPAGRKVKLESVVWHTEGAATFHDKACLGPATFTTAIGQPPTGVDFTWAPAAPEAGVEVTFTPATGIADPSGNIANATFAWNFGDGKTAETKGSKAVKHTFAIGGTYDVTLTVTGEGGLASAKTRRVEVIGKQPVVDFTFSPAEPAVGQEVAFTAQVTDPATPPLTPYTYAWTFGDGGTSAERNPRHTYRTAGTYTVVLAVTNNRGETGRKEKTITVASAPVDRRPVVASLTVNPLVPEAGQAATFTAVASDPDGDAITGYEWDFGDGSAIATTTVPSTSHTFASSNVFTVRVRARDATGFGDWRGLSVYVRPKGGALIGTKVLDNPARTSCRIQVFLPQGASGVKIQIFDMLGRPVLSRDVTGTTFTWDLRDGNGRTLADGLYFYLVTATVAGKTERSEVGKILVVR